LIEDDLTLIVQEIKKAATTKFTGKLTLSLNMNEGGIGQMSLLLDRNLKKPSKS